MMTSEQADIKFSLMIRARDPKCKRCRWRNSTQCSHYFERHHSATRYDPRNGDGICTECHPIWEGRHNGYKEYKIKQIGKKQYAELEQLHNSIMKRDDSIINFIKIYEENKTLTK